MTKWNWTMGAVTVNWMTKMQQPKFNFSTYLFTIPMDWENQKLNYDLSLVFEWADFNLTFTLTNASINFLLIYFARKLKLLLLSFDCTCVEIDHNQWLARNRIDEMKDICYLVIQFFMLLYLYLIIFHFWGSCQNR